MSGLWGFRLVHSEATCRPSLLLAPRCPSDVRGGAVMYVGVIWMVASSSIFHPYPYRVIEICTEALYIVCLQQSSKGSCSLLVSSHYLRADCQQCTLGPPFNSSANAAPVSVQALPECSGNYVGRVVALKQPRIVLERISLRWNEWSYS